MSNDRSSTDCPPGWDVYRTPTDAFISVSSTSRHGSLVSERWTLDAKSDEYVVKQETSVDTGRWHTRLHGRFVRAKREVSPRWAIAALGESGKESQRAMRNLSSVIGSYTSQITPSPTPGKPVGTYTNNVDYGWLFGQTLIEATESFATAGAPPFESISVYGSNPARRCFQRLNLTSDGFAYLNNVYLIAGHLISNSVGFWGGQTANQRTIWKLGHKGIERITRHTMLGTESPHLIFEATPSKR